LDSEGKRTPERKEETAVKQEKPSPGQGEGKKDSTVTALPDNFL